MATTFNAVGGITFIKACLRRIEVIKELFALEIEQGLEVQIPRSLGQSHLPRSFRYYDSVLAIIRENVSEEKR